MLNKELLSIKDTIKSKLHLLECNEALTRWLLIDTLLLNVLDYSREDIIVEYSIDSVDRVSNYNRLDYAVIVKNKLKLLIEAKSLGTDLSNYYYQIEDYFNNILVSYKYDKSELYICLTDGNSYEFYTDSFEQGVLDRKPFFTISLMDYDDLELETLLNFSKFKIERYKNLEENSDCFIYDLDNYYRLDSLNNIYNYYDKYGIDLKIDSVYIFGKRIAVNSLLNLYKYLLNHIMAYEPNLLYSLATIFELDKVKGSINSNLFSLSRESDTDICIKTSQGNVYASISSQRNLILYRINYLMSKSKIGFINTSVKLSKKIKKTIA